MNNTRSLCPFDKSHLIIDARMAKHVEKCSVNHPGKKFERCIFNSNHFYLLKDREAHNEECNELLVCCQNLATVSDFIPPTPEHPATNVSTEESWDTPVGEGPLSYLLVKDKINQHRSIILQGKTDMSSAKKKEFVRAEIARQKSLINGREQAIKTGSGVQ